MKTSFLGAPDTEVAFRFSFPCDGSLSALGLRAATPDDAGAAVCSPLAPALLDDAEVAIGTPSVGGAFCAGFGDCPGAEIFFGGDLSFSLGIAFTGNLLTSTCGAMVSAGEDIVFGINCGGGGHEGCLGVFEIGGKDEAETEEAIAS